MEAPVLHDRFVSAILVGSGIVATVIVANYVMRVWAYQHPDNQWAQGLLSIIG